MMNFYFMVDTGDEIIYGVLKAENHGDAKVRLLEELGKRRINYYKHMYVHDVVFEKFQFERQNK